jgi:hypothetical protein
MGREKEGAEKKKKKRGCRVFRISTRVFNII